MREFLYRKFYQFELDRTISPDKFIASRLFIYYMERYLDGDVSTDAGSDSDTLMQVLIRYGAPPESEEPYDVSQFTTPPTTQQTQDARKYHIGASHLLPDLDTMKSCLSSGYVFCMGFDVFESFEGDQIASSGIMPMPTSGEQIIGGHEVLCFGYDDSLDCNGTPGALLMRNSWGDGWGKAFGGDTAAGGDFAMPYAFAATQHVSDCRIGHIGKPW